MATFLCEKCGKESISQEEYKQHKIDHQLGKADLGVHPVTGEPIMDDYKVTVTPAGETKPVEVPKPVKPERKPVKLKYMWEGNCPKCGKHVDTLEIDVSGKHFCLAYCTADKETLETREVASL